MDNKKLDLNGLHRGLSKIPVEVRVVVGTAKSTISEIVQLKKNSVLKLDKFIGDPVEIFVANKLVAYGELEEDNSSSQGLLLVRLTQVPSEVEQ